MKQKPIKHIVKRNDWQKLRKSFIGTWNKTPQKNIKELRKWLGPVKKTEKEKLRIVMNYLTGTGFRTGTIEPHPSIQLLRDEISEELKRRKRLEVKNV